MAVYFPYKKKRFDLMGGYLGDRGAGPMGSGNIEIPHLPPPGQRTPEQEVSGGLPTHRLNQLNRWWDIEKSPNLNKWGSMPTQTQHTPMAGKKGLSMKNMIKALTEMKKPADLKAPAAKLMGEDRPQLPAPPPFAALGGVNPSIMNVGGLGDEANERWRKIMGYS